jgi:DNA-binding beta-propeller fold protein YncE
MERPIHSGLARSGSRAVVLLGGLLVLAGSAGLFARPPESPETVWALSSFGEADYFYQPGDLTADRERKRIYVVETGNHRVSVFDFEGGFLKTIGGEGQGPGEFARPTGLWVRKDGGLVVADNGNHRLQLFDREGGLVKTIGTKGLRAADLVEIDGLFYTIPSFGNSGYSLNMNSEESHQPLVNVFNGEGEVVRSLMVEDFPDSHPFIRAIKHRVALALSPDGRLFLPYFAVNRTLVFDPGGKETGRFERPLAFKPGEPKLLSQQSAEGRVAMRASMDMISQAAQFGTDGNLYILTFTESFDKLLKGVTNRADMPSPSMRIDVIDPDTFKPVGAVACRPGVRCFTVLDLQRLVYIFEDEDGEVVMTCVRFSLRD